MTIAKAEVTSPVIAVKPYTGSAQTASVPASPLYRVVQNLPQTAPGTYPVMLELTDGANCRWTDSDSALHTVLFTIMSKEGGAVSVKGLFVSGVNGASGGESVWSATGSSVLAP